MEYNFEKTAKQNYEKVFEYIEFLLRKQNTITIEDLKKLYFKLKKKEFRNLALSTLPLIRQMVILLPQNSKIIPQIAQLMKKCDLTHINQEIFQFLKDNKDCLYETHFKETYESEAEGLNNSLRDLDCLFEDTEKTASL